jgi:hypothetical protein
MLEDSGVRIDTDEVGASLQESTAGGGDRRAWHLEHVLEGLGILGRLAAIVIVEQDIRRLAVLPRFVMGSTHSFSSSSE